jgi:hypothetical protein
LLKGRRGREHGDGETSESARSAGDDDKGGGAFRPYVLTDCLSSKLGQMLPIRYSDCCVWGFGGCVRVGRMDAKT